MAADPKLPRAQTSVDQQGGLITPEWYRFFQQLLLAAQEAGILPGVIEDILARLSELEQASEQSFLIQGLVSVQVLGTPANGLVQLQLLDDVDAPGNTYYYGTGPTGTKGWFAVADGLDNGDGIDLSVGSDGVTEISFNADTAEVAHLPGATYKTVQKVIDVMLSPGIITGGEVTELTSTSVRITGGTAVVRIADDNVSELRFFDFPSQDFSVPDVQVTHFYALDYNGGSPVMVESLSSESWDRDTEIPLGSAVRGDGFLNVTPNPYRTGDVITNLIQRLDAIGPVQRDNSVGGLALGETGTRNVTVSAGRLWARVSDFNIAAKNSSVEPMSTVFFNGTNLTVTSGITQWDNQNYNDLGTGALVPLGNNKWANLWFFMSFNGDHYGFAYGTGEHNSLGDAANEGVPSYLTQNFFNQFILLGRFVFQESAATAGSIESAFESVFNVQAVNTHNDLGGLQGGTTGEYYHLTALQNTDVATMSSGGTPGQFWRGDKTYSSTLIGSLTLQSSVTPDITMQYTGAAVASQSLFGMNGGDATATQATINFRANENWGVGARGSRIDFRVTANGSTTLAMAMTIQSTGNGIGTTTPNYAGFGRAVTLESTSNVAYEAASTRADANGVLIGALSGNWRTATAGHQRIAEVQFMADGTTANQRGGEVSFYTKPDASTTLTKRWSIGQAGHYLPAADNAYDVGSGALRVRQYFGAIGTINTSDQRQKTERGKLTQTELAAASQLAREVTVFQMNDAIAEKGDAARLHIGWMAQRVRDVMAEHGLDGFRYGFLCYDEWEEQSEVWQDFEAQDEVWEWSEAVPPEVDEETGEVIREGVAPIRGALLREAVPSRRELVQAYRPAGSLYGLRKDELQAFITAAQEQRIAALEAMLNI